MKPVTSAAGKRFRLIGHGVYTLAEGERLTGIPRASIRRWTQGHTYRYGNEVRYTPPAIQSRMEPIDGTPALEFQDLLEVRFLNTFREAGVSWKAIRIAGLVVLLVSSGALFPDHGVAQGSSDCDYASCALRIRGGSVLAGEAAREVGRYGYFSSPDIRPLLQPFDSASYYFSIVEDNYGSGRVRDLVGLVALLFSPLAIGGWESSPGEWIGYGMLIGGAGLVWSGNRRLSAARSAMADAIWWYNSEIVSPAPSGLGSGR